MSITCPQLRMALLPSHMLCSRRRHMGRFQSGRNLSWPSLRLMEPAGKRVWRRPIIGIGFLS
jgi:hypothetical protein